MNREFTYEPNFADNFHGVLLGLWGTRPKAVQSALTCLMFGLFAALLLWIAGMPRDLVGPMAIGLGIAWGVFTTFALGGWQALLLTRRQQSIGSARIRVSDEGLERTTRAASVKQSWDGISFVQETRRAFLLYDAAHPVFAIEKSALGSGEELLELRRFLRERMVLRAQ